MPFFQFGVGNIYINPVGGNRAANPTPYLIATIQDFTFDQAVDIKELRGQNQAPDDTAPGDKKFSGKFTYGANNIPFENQILYADLLTTGIAVIQSGEAGAIPGSIAYTVTVTNSANFLTDLGVRYAATGVPFTKVASGPTVGQYSVSAGVYTFAAADASVNVLISYTWTSSATGNTVTVANHLMGYGPIVEIYASMPYQSNSGKPNGIHIFQARIGSIKKNLKRDGYLVPEIDFMAFANPAGNIYELFQATP